jgi:hypothetical protein
MTKLLNPEGFYAIRYEEWSVGQLDCRDILYDRKNGCGIEIFKPENNTVTGLAEGLLTALLEPHKVMHLHPWQISYLEDCLTGKEPVNKNRAHCTGNGLVSFEATELTQEQYQEVRPVMDTMHQTYQRYLRCLEKTSEAWRAIKQHPAGNPSDPPQLDHDPVPAYSEIATQASSRHDDHLLEDEVSRPSKQHHCRIKP